MKNMNSLRRSYIVTKFFTYFFLILGAVIMVFPFVWMILTSSKTVPESMQIPPTIFPRQVMLDNFKEAIASLPFANLYWNTILMVFFRVVCAILFSSMAGYAFAKLQFRGKKLLFGIVLIQMSLPSQIFIIPPTIAESQGREASNPLWTHHPASASPPSVTIQRSRRVSSIRRLENSCSFPCFPAARLPLVRPVLRRCSCRVMPVSPCTPD